MKNLTILPLVLLSITLSACAVTSAGVKKGDERNVARSINDVSAERVIQARMKRAYDFQLKGVDVEVKEGIAVLTGNVPNQESRIEAERIAWSAQRIGQVGNEIFIKDRQSTTRNIKDGFLEKSVRARLTADKYVKARNINVETHDGNVYLLGVARNQAELERAAQIASTTKGAREIISYVTVAGIDSKISQLNQSASLTSLSAPNYAAALPSQPSYSSSAQPIPFQAAPTQQRELPSFLTSAPSPYAIPAPSGKVATGPLSSAIPFGNTGPSAPAQISDMGDRLNKEFPTDAELGKYRTGAAGEAVSIIESEPYYIDPTTGKEIPVSYLRNFKK